MRKRKIARRKGGKHREEDKGGTGEIKGERCIKEAREKERK